MSDVVGCWSRSRSEKEICTVNFHNLTSSNTLVLIPINIFIQCSQVNLASFCLHLNNYFLFGSVVNLFIFAVTTTLWPKYISDFCENPQLKNWFSPVSAAAAANFLWENSETLNFGDDKWIPNLPEKNFKDAKLQHSPPLKMISFLGERILKDVQLFCQSANILRQFCPVTICSTV